MSSNVIDGDPNYNFTDGVLVHGDDFSPLGGCSAHLWGKATARRDDAQAFVVDISGKTFPPGTWKSSSITVAADMTVILDGEGDPDSKFLFQSTTHMVFGASVKFKLINGAKWENVLWATGTYFTAGASVDFYGSILATGKVVLGASTTVHGCVISLASVMFGASVLLTVVASPKTIADS